MYEFRRVHNPTTALSRRTVSAALLAGAVSCTHPLPALTQSANRPLEQVVVEASFIFQGVVQKPGSSTMPRQVPPDRNTYIVRVSEAFTSSARDFQGKDITVKVDNYSRVKEGRITAGGTYVFLAQPFLYGDSVAVAAEPADRTQAVLTAVRQRSDLILKDRLDSSELVVSGTVARLRPFSKSNEGDNSEHDADWQAAELIVRTVERGKPPARLEVVFPGARTFQWSRSPKFKVEQSGVWLLRRSFLDKQPVYSALYPLDFLSPAELERVRRLLGKGKTTNP